MRFAGPQHVTRHAQHERDSLRSRPSRPGQETVTPADTWPAAPPQITLTLLDSFELRFGDQLVPVPVPAQRLLAFLAIHDRPLRRAYVAGTLWIDADEDHAAGSFRSALWRLRRTGLALVDADATRLGLALDVGVDFRRAVAYARRVINAPRAEEAREETSLLLRSDLLPDWYDDWVLLERERFQQLRVHALEVLSDQLIAARDYAVAAELGLAVISSEPLRESAHRALIRVHLAEGNYAAALRQYHRFRELLAKELGLEPSAAMKSLISSVTNG
jgi:DNA-binding SARP family transcriptional activator